MAQELGRLFVTVGANVDEFKQKMTEASKVLKDAGESMTKVGKNLSLKVTAPLVAIGTAAVATVSKFDDSMSQVAALSGAVGDEFVELRELAQELGATTAHTASSAADAMGYLALAGWDVNQILAATPDMLSLASAGAMDLARAADIVTDTMSMFQLEATEAGRAADVFASAASKSNTNIEQLGEAMKMTGAAANASGMDLEETAAILGVLADSGIKGSMAGTTLNAMLRDLKASAEDGAIAVGDTTVKVYDSTGAMRAFSDIMGDVENATRNMNDEQRDAAMSAVFAQQSIRGVNILLASGAEAYRGLETEIRSSGGAAKEMAEIMEGNIGGAFRALASQTEGLMIQLGDILAPIVKDTIIPLVMNFGEKIKGLLEWFSELSPGMQNIILGLTGLFVAAGPVLVIAGEITTAIGVLTPIISGLAPALAIVGKALLALVTGAAAPFVLVGAAIAGAIALIYHFRDEIGAVLGAAIDWVGEKLQAFAEFFAGVFEFIHDNTIGIFERMWARIKEIINWIIGGVNSMIKKLNAISVTAPDWIPGMGGKTFGFNLNEIPQLADGGNITQPGLALVGEKGPELLRLPRGAQVEPLQGARPAYNVTNNFYSPRELDEYEITRRTETTFRKLEIEYARRF